MYRINCPHCGEEFACRFRYRDDSAGQNIKCEACTNSFLLPIRPTASVVDKLHAAERTFSLTTKVLVGSLAWAVAFSVFATIVIQRPVERPVGGQGFVLLFAFLSWAFWSAMTVAVLNKQRWAPGVILGLTVIGLMFNIHLLISGESRFVTPKWPIYVGLANGVAIIFASAWTFAARNEYEKLEEKYKRAKEVESNEPPAAAV